MGASCAVVGCTSHFHKDPKPKLFRIPSIITEKNKKFQSNPEKQSQIIEVSKLRRHAWMRALNRGPLSENQLQYMRICSNHFLSGKPTDDILDVNNPDWAPCTNLGYSSGFAIKTQKDLERYQRITQKALKENERAEGEIEECEQTSSENIESDVSSNDSLNNYLHKETQTESKYFHDSGTQTDLTMGHIDHLHLIFDGNQEFINELKEKIGAKEFIKESFAGNDKRTRFYTGLASHKHLFLIHETIHPFLPNQKFNTMTTFQQLILTLIKLRLNLTFADLADRFGIVTSTAARIFRKILHILAICFKNLVHWPDRVTLRKTIPDCFKNFPGLTVIIDCFEIYIEKSSLLLTKALTWSTYKHHNTVKVLIAITGQGTICFISEGWGGRASDKHVVENSKFLDKIIPGDVVLADRGFLIKESLDSLGASLNIPAFTKGKSQLQPLELEKTRCIANVRIHVERVIGSLRQKFQILSGIIPISMLCPEVDGISVLDEILLVCSALHNFCPTIVK